MSNRVMVDSSILVECVKGTKTRLFISLVENSDTERFINETVVIEFLFQLLKVSTGKAPKTLQSSGRLPITLQNNTRITVLNPFDFLPTNNQLVSLVPTFMQQCNLLPNDAIILATCKIHGIMQLATHDSDFDYAAPAEGIQLLKESTV